MFYAFVYGVLGLILLAYTVDLYFNIGDEPGEPSRVRSSVPLIGHVLGLMRDGPSYYQKTRCVTFRSERGWKLWHSFDLTHTTAMLQTLRFIRWESSTLRSTSVLQAAYCLSSRNSQKRYRSDPSYSSWLVGMVMPRRRHTRSLEELCPMTWATPLNWVWLLGRISMISASEWESGCWLI